jgi:predicted dehydrogenase
MSTAPVSAARLPIAVIGAGGIGRFHIERALRSEAVSLAAIADPTDAAQSLAREVGVPWFADYRAMQEAVRPRAAIVATPNNSHVEIGLELVARRVPMVVEKPIADDPADARRLCEAAQASGVPLMVGHHRRHNPIIARARALIAEGVVGRPVSVTAMCTWLKPDAYYDIAWRRLPGGGPVLINMIHDIDLLRHLVGEIATVQAITSSAVRGHPVEDTAAAILRFRNGALGSVSLTDAAVAPWNWDLAAGEAAHYPRQDVDSIFISGTEGSLTLPRLEVWRYRGARGWHDPLSMERTAPHLRDPYAEQLRHVRAVVEGREEPLCSGFDGMRTLEAIRAVHDSAATGLAVELPA